MDENKYLSIDSSGLVVGLIICDSVNDLQLPAGNDLVAYTGQAGIGWTRNEDGSFTPPPAEE